MDQVLRHVAVVGEQLLGVLGQAVAAVSEAGVVVVGTDARVEADAVNDLARVQTMGGGVSVEFVEVGHAHGEVGVGEELDRLSFGAVGKQHGDVLFDRALLEQSGEGLGPRRPLTNDDARGVKVVVQGAALTQEFGREDEVVATEFSLELCRIADRHG